MNISPRTQAMLLLTAWFTKPAKGEPKPLTPTEWGRFAQWLNEHDATPEDLLITEHPVKALEGCEKGGGVTSDRVAYLLGRSAALALTLEKWQRAGLWVMTRADDDYPARLRRRLKSVAPPLLFGCGHRPLLADGGIAVIGSREAGAEDLAFAAKLGSDIALQGSSVVSGGARGVDEAAMLGALEEEGTVIGVLADGLLRAAASAKYRRGLMARKLVLVSPFNPEAGFDVGNAMARNKYVYCLADAAVVVSTGKGKGGTWNGAVENLKQRWVPLWVRPNPDVNSGNALLVRGGGRWLPDSPVDVPALTAPAEVTEADLRPTSLFDYPPAIAVAQGKISEPVPTSAYLPLLPDKTPVRPELRGPSQPESRDVSPPLEAPSEYQSFLTKLEHEVRISPKSPEALRQALRVSKAQLNAWLKQAMSEGKVIKLNRPERYYSPSAGQGELDL